MAPPILGSCVLFFKVLSLPMLIIGVLLLVQALLPIMSGYKQMDLPCTDLRIKHEAHTQSRSYHCGCQEYYYQDTVCKTPVICLEYWCTDTYTYTAYVHPDAADPDHRVLESVLIEEALRDADVQCDESTKPVIPRKHEFLEDGQEELVCYEKSEDNTQTSSFHRKFQIPCFNEPNCYTAEDIITLEEAEAKANLRLLYIAAGMFAVLFCVWFASCTGIKGWAEREEEEEEDEEEQGAGGKSSWFHELQ
ncbi:hypothetical protein TeGR_g3282, partial [Tetraparma gracilis]